MTENNKIIKTNRGNLDYSSKTLIMGILNITPDSFSDGGKYNDLESALIRAKKMENAGADIIDIGAESSRPYSDRISAEEEKMRLLPVLKEVLKVTTVPISIDSYKSSVVRAALKEGASIVNDISGLRFDAKMAETAAEFSAPVIIMHIQGRPETMQDNPSYQNLIFEIKEYLWDGIKIAKEAGIADDSIIIDPGIGFGKEQLHNLQILNRLESFKELNYPILIGTSRKSLINYVNKNEVNERLFGTAATVSTSIIKGANIVRIHDVAEIKKVAVMTDAVKWEGKHGK
ncbi:Dihydropteroate synthase [Halanaerobium saccharolyticum subsp. saccharolyticum DSM 6643]|uniref:Dihydropteroate synthase n=1 Tax=Halanaerobium saccharolyticum subsp. saccharolyticum DSM 6643 TaxID=1293054 RepID=M5DYN7_9FIRM|nr:dihydropteroate synthase [Halanaerobium saccharolyticum]CCU78288.1 Dihydropteroate synthase [Halanaerobium saccharolyticum subsp. saccharolyticum DSM 6643]